MEIRTNNKFYKKIVSQKTSLIDIDITLDNNVEIPIIMFKNDMGELKEYLRGFKEVRSYLKYGFNHISKNCPYRHRKCIGKRCALYFIDNNTGDCAIIWQLFKGKV